MFEEIALCTDCELRQTCKQVVVGSELKANKHVRYMLVGEAPGKEEDEVGLPFVGMSGRYLFDMLGEVGFRRSNFYITNIVKCRPPDNADPTLQQISICATHLRYQLGSLNPEIIVTVGRHALNWFCKGVSISRVHGERIASDTVPYMVFPLFHPAFILRNRNLETVFREDIVKLYEYCWKRLRNERKRGRGFRVMAGRRS